MKFTLGAIAAVGATLLNVVAAADLDPIVIKGNKFFFKTNGTEFFMKGVAYQAESTSSSSFYSDPLADSVACKRDVPLLEELGANVIRVYAVDPTLDHTDCMALLQAAGIYVVSDLSEPQVSINRDVPLWDGQLYTRYTAVVDAMAKYSNVLGFFAGNEVSNQPNNTSASPYVKAAVRDTKAYIKEKNYRTIPVGYATNDDADIRVNLADYFNCNTEEEGIDFWGYNIYSWCGKSSFADSGYDVRTKEYANYSVPVFFAEFGCNQVTPRLFTEVAALFSDQMTDVWSGGIVYMYFEEANNYGLVEIDNGSAKKLPDFNTLKKQYAAVSPSSVVMSSFKPTNTALRACPVEGDDWKASPTLPPTPNKDLCSCMVSGLTCAPKSTVKAADYGDLFSFLCPGASCDGINGNGTTGVYGAFSMCNSVDRLAWAMNSYYLSQKSDSKACDFSGKGETKTATSTTGDCATLLKEAGGLAGTSTVTSNPNAKSGSGKSAANGLSASVFVVITAAFFSGLAAVLV